jgi:Mn2+/Fe2+ NRAMP family transporter
MTLLLADVGATVTPWMIFFQQSAVVDKGMGRKDIEQGRYDTLLGAAIAATAAVATLVAASSLFANHVSVVSFSDGADFATALQPYIGNVGASLFALGIIEAGLVAAMTISASSAYALGEVLHTRHSLNAGFLDGKAFYACAIASVAFAAAIVLIPNAPLLAITLAVNIIATLLMAPALLFLLLLANDREIIGPLANSPRSNWFGGAIVVAIALMGSAYGVVSIFPSLIPK